MKARPGAVAGPAPLEQVVVPLGDLIREAQRYGESDFLLPFDRVEKIIINVGIGRSGKPMLTVEHRDREHAVAHLRVEVDTGNGAGFQPKRKTGEAADELYFDVFPHPPKGNLMVRQWTFQVPTNATVRIVRNGAVVASTPPHQAVTAR